MKKSKLLFVGLIALVLAGGLVLASCGRCPGGGDCEVWVTEGTAGNPRVEGSACTDSSCAARKLTNDATNDAASNNGRNAECTC